MEFIRKIRAGDPFNSYLNSSVLVFGSLTMPAGCVLVGAPASVDNEKDPVDNVTETSDATISAWRTIETSVTTELCELSKSCSEVQLAPGVTAPPRVAP